MLIVDILTVLTQKFIDKVPALVYAIIFLALGYAVGKILGYITKRALVEAKVDKYVSQKHFKVEISSFSGVVVRWLVYLIFVQQATDVLNITVISTIVNKIIAFVPSVIGAAAVIMAADAIGIYLKNNVIGSDDTYAKLAGHIVFFTVMYVGIATALPMVGIDATLINQILLLLIGAVALGIAVAVALGLKETISEITKEYYEKKSKR